MKSLEFVVNWLYLWVVQKEGLRRSSIGIERSRLVVNMHQFDIGTGSRAEWKNRREKAMQWSFDYMDMRLNRLDDLAIKLRLEEMAHRLNNETIAPIAEHTISG